MCSRSSALEFRPSWRIEVEATATPLRAAPTGPSLGVSDGGPSSSCGLLTRLWPILLVLISALVRVGTISSLVTRVERRGMSRGWAVAIVFLSLSVIVIVLGLLTVPALVRELIELMQNAPQIQARFAAALEHSRLTEPLAASVQHFQLEKLIKSNAGQPLAYSGSVLAAIGYTVTSVVLALYIIADRDRARGVLYAWTPRLYHMRLARVLLKLETIVGGYLRGQVITSLAIAVFAFTLLALCRVPNALGAGLIAAIVLAGFLIYQSFESRILVPRIYGRALRLSSATVLVALLIGGESVGIDS